MSHAYPAPAKLNLFLHVVGRRADGYHLLQSLFRFIDRADTVHLELRDDGRVEREGDRPEHSAFAGVGFMEPSGL